ncbi:MAG: MarR family transcriptional regulator [Umezawaea sp.]
MTSNHRRGPRTADVSSAVESAAEVLTALWDRTQQTSKTRVSPSQMQALAIVERHGQINLNGLAAELDAIPSSASRLCDRLQAAGLLTRAASVHNRREVMLALTRDGRALLAEIGRNRHQALARILADMSPSGREALLTGLSEFNEAVASAGTDESWERHA